MTIQACIALASLILAVHCRQPHIVLIVADDLGWNDVGYHGSDVKTPNMDKLANDGVRLEHHYVMPVCSPTRSALLSGRHPIHTGMYRVLHLNHRKCHPLADRFLSDELRDLGYATHMVGKWHLGFYTKRCLPVHRGFDTFFGYFTSTIDYYKHSIHMHLDMHTQRTGQALQQESSYTGVYSTHLFTQKAQDVLKRHHQSHSKQPLFLFLPFQATHGPAQVPEPYEEQYNTTVDLRQRRHRGQATAMDEGIGNITTTLQELGMWNNTILVFLSDNGGVTGKRNVSRNTPLRGGKTTLWQGGVRVNAFVHSPLLRRRRGAVMNDLFHVTDWFPTLLHAAGADVTHMSSSIDGVNQWPTISDGAPARRHEVLLNIYPKAHASPGQHKGVNFLQRSAIIVDKWKMITGCQEASEYPNNVTLFNLEDDPSETTNLCDEYPEVLERIKNRLLFYKATTVPELTSAELPPLEPGAPVVPHDNMTPAELPPLEPEAPVAPHDNMTPAESPPLEPEAPVAPHQHMYAPTTDYHNQHTELSSSRRFGHASSSFASQSDLQGTQSVYKLNGIHEALGGYLGGYLAYILITSVLLSVIIYKKFVLNYKDYIYRILKK